MIPEASDCAPSQEAIQSAKKLHDDISQRFPIFAELFEAWWSVWHRVCEAKISQDTDKVDPCQASNEYSVLMALGPRIVPMVVYEMATYPNKYSHGVYLCKNTMHAIKPFANFLHANPQPRSRLGEGFFVPNRCTRRSIKGETATTSLSDCPAELRPHEGLHKTPPPLVRPPNEYANPCQFFV